MNDVVPGARVPTSGNGAFMARRSATHWHRGVDLNAPLGTAVYTPRDGRVVRVVEPGTRGFSGYGRAVVLEVEGAQLLFAHLDSAVVVPGEVVRRGMVIGTVGRTCGTVEEPGRECGGAHLHFEALAGRYPVASEAERLDPIPFLVPPRGLV